MKKRVWMPLTVGVAMLCAGCSVRPNMNHALPGATAPPAPQTVYWSFFNSPQVNTPEVEFAPAPVTIGTVATLISSSTTNHLSESNAMRFDASGRLWILNQSGSSSGPALLSAYAPPLTAASVPLLTLTLNASSGAYDFVFDAAGNPWVMSNFQVGQVAEYLGPFSASASPTPATTITLPFTTPGGVAFDAAGSLYVSNQGANGTQSIAVFHAPFSNTPAWYLNGVTGTGGVAFDPSGNLFATNNTNSTGGAIVRYNASNLASGAVPNIVDSTGIANNAYGAGLAFDRAGNLYDADCGNAAALYVFPNAAANFSSTLAPVAYRDANIENIDCVWGVAIR